MVKINRGFLKMGMETQDSLWGMKTPRKDVSVDDEALRTEQAPAGG